MEAAYLYVVFSATPYRVGRLIRRCTGEVYNHTSLSLEDSLEPMYGFARRFYRTPFYGGFVKESLSRHHVHGSASTVKVCRLPITREQRDALQDKLNSMYARREHYLYNHLSVITVPFGRLVPVEDAYICVEFCTHILQQIGVGIDPRKYCSVGKLAQLLDPYTIYTGPVPAGEYDTAYYDPKPLPHPVLTSLRSIAALFPRLQLSRK